MLPNTIAIGGHEFNVEIIKRAGACRRADIDHLTCTIHIKAALTASKREQALLHEIIHEIDQQCHLELDEPTLWRLAEALYATLKTNRLWFGRP